ncbi:MAG TPA: hypothetical protein VMS31_16135, partial [Pyrinomonadaceae bacterium]|nr:hypothetical protein [Pyrinomonadaceae bacterium]
PNDFRENHYYPARETDAAAVQVRRESTTEQEKFLFYRGVGNFDLPLSVKLVDDQVVVKNVGPEPVRKAVVFENRAGKLGYRIVDLPADGSAPETKVNRPELRGDFNALRRELKALLVSHGLYEKEADAMLETWRSSWFEEGLRVFYLMPRQTTDSILPITIDPEPEELVRVLVGRTELLTPEMEQTVIAQLKTLDDPSPAVRQTALKEIQRYGRFTESVLTQILSHTGDPVIKAKVERLLNARD